MINCNSAHTIYIGKHSGMPLFSRLGLISLLFLPLVSFAEITCVRNSDGSWTCSGDGGDGSSSTNGHATVCATNRTITINNTSNSGGLSYAQCLSVKQSISDLTTFSEDGDDNPSILASILLSDFQVSGGLLESDYPDIDFWSNDNYLLMQYSADALFNLVDEQTSKLLTLREISDGINCSPPSSNSSVSTNESVVCTSCSASDSGGSGGSSAGSGDCGCNCSELLQSILTEVQQTKAKINSCLEQLKALVGYVKSINSNLAYITTNNFIYANDFRTKSGSTFTLASRLSSFSQYGITSSSYTDLNWMSRVELLLASIAGASTNSITGGLSNTQSLTDGVSAATDQMTDYVNGVKDTYTTNLDGLKSLFTACKTIFPSSQPDGSLTLYDGSDWLGGSSLTVEISPTIQNGARACTGLIWCCLGLVLFISIVCGTIPIMVRFFGFIFNLFFKVLS